MKNQKLRKTITLRGQNKFGIEMVKRFKLVNQKDNENDFAFYKSGDGYSHLIYQKSTGTFLEFEGKKVFYTEQLSIFGRAAKIIKAWPILFRGTPNYLKIDLSKSEVTPVIIPRTQ